MELGKIQKAWIKALKEHPERQMKGSLGWVNPNGHINACCLGQGLLCLKEAKGESLEEGAILDGANPVVLKHSFRELGLNDHRGTTRSELGRITSLAGMNDNGYTWPQIAEFIEKNPEKVFTKSV